SSSWAWDVNELGQVTGFSAIAGDTISHAFLYPGPSGQMLDLDVPTGALSQGLALNELGQVMGFQLTSGGALHAFVTPFPQLSPDKAIQQLVDAVKALVQSGALSKGRGQGLIAKLQAALAYLHQGQTQLAINSVAAFANQVGVFEKTGKLTAALGQPLIDGANAVIHQLGG